MEHNPKSEAELIHAVGDWANKNFGRNHFPHLGILEEIGEICHCILKNRQGIRGYKKMEFFIEQLTDGLADATIFLAHWCYMHNSFFVFDRSPEPPSIADLNVERVLNHLLQACSVMLTLYDRQGETTTLSVTDESTYNMVAQRVLVGLELLAKVWNINLRLAVAETWNRVAKRDWVKNPTNADSSHT